jgi:hypothetical protein
MSENKIDILNGFRRHSINNGRIKILICEVYGNSGLISSNVLKYGLEPQKLMQFVEKEILQVKDWCTTNNLEIIECANGHITYRNFSNSICTEKYFIMELTDDMNADNEE